MDLSTLAADGWYEPPPPRWPEGYRVPEQFAPQMQPSPQVTDAPAPQFPEPARRGFGDMLAEAVAAAGPMPVDRNASGGTQFLQGLVGGGLGGFAQRRIDAMKGREAVQASLAERQALRNAEAVTQNTERRAQILAEGNERKAEAKRLTAEQAGYIEVPPNVARLAGRPDLAGKRVSKAQADALGGAARIALDERQASAKAAGDVPATNPRIQTLDLRLDQMRRKRSAIDDAINRQDWAALKKLGVPTFRAAQAKVAQLDADMQKADAERTREQQLAAIGGSHGAQTNVLSLTTKVQADDDIKTFQQVRDGYGRVRSGSAQGTAQGDITMIYGLMRMLDPTSVVRESEFATAQNAAGVPDQVRNLWNKMLSGQRLGADQRAGFVRQARDLYREKSIPYSRAVDQYGRQADALGVPRDLVLRDYQIDETGDGESKPPIESFWRK